MKRLNFVTLLAVLLAPVISSAAVLDFATGTAGIGGMIVDTGAGQAQGIDIYIDTLVASGTSADGVYNVDGALACATGSGGSCAALSFDTVAGTFSIVGSVPGLGVASTTLLTGTIDTFKFDTTGGVAMFTASGTDTKDPALLAAVGLPTDSAFSFTGFSIGFSPVACGEGRVCYQAISTDFLNSSGVGGEAVPEPATLLLLGGGVLGLARARRRSA
jgi:hypothetical protein